MSTATTEKPATSLGSFLTKLTPVVETKSAEPIVEAKAETAEPSKGEAEQSSKKDATPAVEAKDAAKGSESEVTEKRLKDTQKWGNEEHKARLEAERNAAALQARLERIEKKLDGTYEEPAVPSLEQAKTEANTTGRIRASHHAAIRQYGEKFVMETVWNQGSPYQELQARDPQVRARVMNADDPVLEAIAAVKEDQDAQKYGRTPEEIRKKMEAELTPRLTQDILKSLETKSGAPVKTLGNVRGDTERTSRTSEAPARLDFRSVFPWGASRN